MTIIGDIIGYVFSVASIYFAYKGVMIMIKGEGCDHILTHHEDWPDGGGIEVCDECEMSRYIWEQGESNWIMVRDLSEKRAKLQKFFDEAPDPKPRDCSKEKTE